jgi:hypothetical protein
VAKSGRWVAKLVALLLATAALWVRIWNIYFKKSFTLLQEAAEKLARDLASKGKFSFKVNDDIFLTFFTCYFL